MDGTPVGPGPAGLTNGSGWLGGEAAIAALGLGLLLALPLTFVDPADTPRPSLPLCSWLRSTHPGPSLVMDPHSVFCLTLFFFFWLGEGLFG